MHKDVRIACRRSFVDGLSTIIDALANSSYEESVRDTITGEPSILLMKCCSIDTEGANDPLTNSDNDLTDSLLPFASAKVAKSLVSDTFQSYSFIATDVDDLVRRLYNIRI